MRRNSTYFSFKIYQLKCTIERCNIQILDGLECSNPTHVNVDHSRHPSEGIVKLVWAKIVFSGQCLLPNCHSCSLYLLKIANDRSKSNYSLSQQSYLHLPTASSYLPQPPPSTLDCCILSNSPLVCTLQTKRYGIQSSSSHA
jgi:hypothetical protein